MRLIFRLEQHKTVILEEKWLLLFQHCICIITPSRAGSMWKIKLELPGQFGESTLSSAIGISLLLRLYFTAYPSSCHNTDTFSITEKDNIEI